MVAIGYRRPRRLVLAVFLVVGMPGRALAQTADSLVSFQSELFPSATDANANQKIGFNVIRVNATLPVPVTRSTFLLPSIKYEHTDVMIEGDTNTPAPVLRSVQASFGVAQGIADRWTVIASFGAGLASDFSQPVNRHDLVFTGTALVLYHLGAALSLGGGAIYDQRTGSPRPLPAFVLNWRPGENFRVRGFVPARVDAEFRTTKWLTLGAFALLNGDRYALGERKYGTPDLQIALSTAEIGPKVTLSAGDWVHFDLSVGVPAYRRYELDRDGHEELSASLATVPIYGVRIRLGPSMWEQKPDPGPTKVEAHGDSPSRTSP
jgi:Domain of unknown function (DUF6268)